MSDDGSVCVSSALKIARGAVSVSTDAINALDGEIRQHNHTKRQLSNEREMYESWIHALRSELWIRFLAGVVVGVALALAISQSVIALKP